MPKFYTLILVAALSGCASVAPIPIQPQVITKTEYVVRIPPAQLLTLPAQVSNIDVDTAKQSDVAAWLLQKEAYTQTLENMIKEIGAFLNEQQAAVNK